MLYKQITCQDQLTGARIETDMATELARFYFWSWVFWVGLFFEEKAAECKKGDL